MGKGGNLLRAALRRYISAAPKIGKYQNLTGAALGATSGVYYGRNKATGPEKGRTARTVGHAATGALGGALVTHGLRGFAGIAGSARIFHVARKRTGSAQLAVRTLDVGANLAAPVGGAVATTILGQNLMRNRKQYLASKKSKSVGRT